MGSLDTYRNPPDIGVQSIVNGVFTPSASDISDGVFNRTWTNHPDRILYESLVLSNPFPLTASVATRIAFTSVAVITFPGPPVLDRVYVYDTGVYYMQFEATFTGATSVPVILTLIEDTGNAFYTSPPVNSVTSQGAQLIRWTALYGLAPLNPDGSPTSDGQWTTGVALNPGSAISLATASFQVCCLGRLGK